MKRLKLKVHLYWNKDVWFNNEFIKMGDFAETEYTNDIEEARKWVADADHGEIFNEQNIKIQ
jgi:hypothetical protein